MAAPLVLIGAGTRGARRICSEYQPFLEVDGRTCVEIVLDAVTSASNDCPVHIWGPVDRLKETLAPIIRREEGRREIRIFPEMHGPIDSLLFASRGVAGPSDGNPSAKNYLREAYGAGGDRDRPMFFLPCDIPLISREEIDFLMKNADPACDLRMGWSLKDGFDSVLAGFRAAPGGFEISRTKFNFSKFVVSGRRCEARFNNTYCGRPLRVDLNLFRFFHVLYVNRNLIRKVRRRGREVKRIDVAAFSRWLGSFAGYLVKRSRQAGPQVLHRGLLILRTYFHTLGLEESHYPFVRTLVGALELFDRRPAERYLDTRFFEANILGMTGNRIGMYLTNVIGPVFDIDIEYEYRFLKENYGRLRAAIERYYADAGLKKLP
jgi:hypothetical protein